MAQCSTFHRKYEITFYRKYEITGIFINWVLATNFMLAPFISCCKLCPSLCSFTALSLFLLFTDLYISDSIFFFWIVLFFLLTSDLHLVLRCQSYLCSAWGRKVLDSSSSLPAGSGRCRRGGGSGRGAEDGPSSGGPHLCWSDPVPSSVPSTGCWDSSAAVWALISTHTAQKLYTRRCPRNPPFVPPLPWHRAMSTTRWS